MAELADLSLRDLLDRVAAPEPGPSAGACAAWACALAASLVELTAEVTLRRGESEHMTRISREARALRDEAVELAERDVALYAAVLDARRAGDGAAEAAALSAAADPPLDIAVTAARVNELAHEAASRGVEALRGDALAGARLAGAACGAASRLVEIDLAATPEDPRIAQARHLRP
jgi:formiminotetrahydrofolate cyclodeaminase